MKRALLTACVLLTGCAVQGPAAIQVAASCEFNGMRIEIEVGAGQTINNFYTPLINGPTPEAVCANAGQVFQGYRSEYEARWGVVDLEGWVIRLRSTTIGHRPGDPSGYSIQGTTFQDEKVIDLAQVAPNALPHELHHVALGPSSADHHGWCDAFVPWEEAVPHWDDRAYLSCN